MTPFSLAPCQLTANSPVGSDSPGPGRLTHLLPHPGDDLLKIFNRLPGKNSSSPRNFLSRIGRLDFPDALAAENKHSYRWPAARTPSCVAGACQHDDIVLFSRNISTDIALGVDIRTFRVRGLRKIARHAASPGRISNPGCYRRPRRLSMSKSSPRAAPAHGLPGAISCPRRHSSPGPGFARYTPALRFFPGPPGVGFP